MLLPLCLFLSTLVSAFATSAMSDQGNHQTLGFNLPVHRVSRARQERDGPLSNNVSIANSREFAYLVHINAGGQDFQVTLDTGSSDLWVVSSECTSDDCKGVPKYNRSASSSLSVSEAPFRLTYLLGSVLGTVAEETITFGPYEISSQIFALADKTIGLGLSSTGNSGILGLSFPPIASISLTSGTTLLENLFSHFSESQRYFAFKLGRDQSQGANTASSFTVGQLDPVIANDTSGFAYTNVSREGSNEYNYWKLPIHGLTINSNPFAISHSLMPQAQTPLAVLDTGTTLILGPTPDVTSFWATVGASRKNPNTGSWEVRCERGVTIGFILGAFGAEREYVVDPADISWAEGGSADGWCMGGVQANDAVNAGDWLLGDVFLRNVYVTHHSETASQPPTIGLLSLTDPISAMSAFRAQRGSDPSPPPLVQNRSRVQGGDLGKCKLSFVAMCTLSSVCGYIGSAMLTVLVLARRGRGKKGGRKRNARIS